jgi:hypothetical protein
MFWRFHLVRQNICRAIVVLGAVAVGYQTFAQNREDQPRSPRSESSLATKKLELAGSESCRECHAAVCDSYSLHPMSQSFKAITSYDSAHHLDQNSGFQQEIDSNVLRYKVSVDAAGTMTHSESITQGDSTIYQVEYPISYSIGSGKRGSSYVVAADGMAFQSPIGWYSTAQKWDFSPGYQQKNLHFERKLEDRCINCHAGVVNRDPNAKDRYLEPMAKEAAISCEKCHGPAAGHVAWHRGQKNDLSKDPILSWKDLSPRAQASICNQCHLVGGERVLRAGRSEFDFTPGEHFSDTWIAFSPGPRVKDNHTAAVDQVNQMMVSACYVNSQSQLNCVSCHDPHSVPTPDERVSFYRERCIACHESGKTECSMPEPKRREVNAADSCFECHMPKLPTDDVAHTTLTDHRVLKRPADFQADEKEDMGAAKLVLFDAEDYRELGSEVKRAKAIVMAQAALRSNDTYVAFQAYDLLCDLRAEFAADTELLFHTGIAAKMIDRLPEAVEAFQAVLNGEPKHEAALMELAAIADDQGEYMLAVDYATRLISVNPRNKEAFGRAVHALGQINRLDEGIKLARHASSLFPYDRRFHGWLSNALQVKGIAEEAELHKKMLDRLEKK